MKWKLKPAESLQSISETDTHVHSSDLKYPITSNLRRTFFFRIFPKITVHIKFEV
jgi:hypothetical protein